MAVKIRLARHGAKKAPYYRVVVADGRARRDGRFIEIVGRYNPRTKPSTVELDLEKVDAWIAKGAQPTEAAGEAHRHRTRREGRSGRGGQGLQEGRRQGRRAEAAAAEKAAAERRPLPRRLLPRGCCRGACCRGGRG